MLTPQGIEEELHLMVQFLRRMESEYRMLEKEIARVLQESGPHETLQHSRSVQRCAPSSFIFFLNKELKRI